MVTNSRMELNVDAVLEKMVGMGRWLCEAAVEGTASKEVERKLFQDLLEMGHRLFGSYLQMVGDGDLGEQMTLPDGRVVRRLKDPHVRRLRTVFGEFSLSRRVYGSEERKTIQLIPTDQRLQLPESDVSYLLQEWDQLLGVEQAFGVVRDTLNTILRIKQSVDTLERSSQHMAEAAPAFREQQPAPEPTAEGELLIATEDNKGIPMVRPVEAPPPGAHLTKGQKKNKKKMACVGCVYSVDRHVRTPEELVKTLFRDPDRPQTKPPKAQHKRYWASLTRDVAGEEVCGQTEVFQHLRDEIALRRKPQQKLINLTDGQRSLETDRHEYLPCDVQTIGILDLMHVLPRLWEAAHLFHPEASDEATAFVRHRLERVLHGQAKSVIADLRRQGTTHKLRGAKRKKLKRQTDFLESNLHRMRYDEYLEAGYPIATGVIEGACRHVVKDRMERSGMRWKVPGAQAMLALRTIQTNGDWEEFQDFRVRHETQRLYPHAENFRAISWPLKSITA
jgi:hypothetical protein